MIGLINRIGARLCFPVEGPNPRGAICSELARIGIEEALVLAISHRSAADPVLRQVNYPLRLLIIVGHLVAVGRAIEERPGGDADEFDAGLGVDAAVGRGRGRYGSCLLYTSDAADE